MADETPTFDKLLSARTGFRRRTGGATPNPDDIVDPPSTAHPGFKNVQASIAKRQGISSERAGAILGEATRRASAAAKRANPRLKRVKG